MSFDLQDNDVPLIHGLRIFLNIRCTFDLFRIAVRNRERNPGKMELALWININSINKQTKPENIKTYREH